MLPRPVADPLGQLLTLEWVQEIGEHAKERRERIEAIAECPRCGKDVACVAETDGWVQERSADGRLRWHHESYGPAVGECCGLLIADWWEGTFAYEFPEPAQP